MKSFLMIALVALLSQAGPVATEWCAGDYDPQRGTNFARCLGAAAPRLADEVLIQAP
jgi:hypothetical protein